MHTFEASAGAVLSLVARHETVYVGCQDGHVKVFDLETKTLVRTIIAQEVVIHRTQYLLLTKPDWHSRVLISCRCP